jgi:hypothetical protein
LCIKWFDYKLFILMIMFASTNNIENKFIK